MKRLRCIPTSSMAGFALHNMSLFLMAGWMIMSSIVFALLPHFLSITSNSCSADTECGIICYQIKLSKPIWNGIIRAATMTRILFVSYCESQSAFKCINGTCIEPPETGKAVISIINGTFANQADEITQYSAYVKVFLDQKYLMKTRTIEGSNKPIFNQAFVTPVITSDTQIGFIVFDRDEAEEKLLLTVQMTVDFILAMKLNGSVTCQPLGSPKGQLCFSIKWLKELRWPKLVNSSSLGRICKHEFIYLMYSICKILPEWHKPSITVKESS